MQYKPPNEEEITLKQIQRLEDEIAEKGKEIKLIKGKLTKESNPNVTLVSLLIETQPYPNYNNQVNIFINS